MPHLVTSFERIASESYLFADSRKKRKRWDSWHDEEGTALSHLVFHVPLVTARGDREQAAALARREAHQAGAGGDASRR